MPAPAVCIGRQAQCDLCTSAIHYLEGDRQAATPLLLFGSQIMLANMKPLTRRTVGMRRQRRQRSPTQRSRCRVHRTTAGSRQLIRPATATPGKARTSPVLRCIHATYTCFGAYTALQGAAQAWMLCRCGALLKCWCHLPCRYNEYHKCLADPAKTEQDCSFFQRAYRAMCPNEWVSTFVC